MTDELDEIIDWDGSVPLNPVDADRLLWRIRRAEAQIAENDAIADAEIKPVEDWRKRANEKQRAVIDAADWALDGWARANHELDPRTVSWSYPHGTIRLTAPRHTIEPTDHAAAVKTLRSLGLDVYVKDRPEVRSGELKKAVLGDEPREGFGVQRIADEDVPPSEGGGADEYEFYRIVVDGEIIPGIHIERSKTRSFSQTPPKGDGDE